MQIYDVGLVGEQVFLAMEYVQGETLGEWQKQAGRTWQATLAVYRQVGEGLAAAHAAGLRVVAYEHGEIARPTPARVQRVCAVRGSALPSVG